MSKSDASARLESLLGYQFKDQELLLMALRHSSYVNEHGMDRTQCNERLEFLGDAVLELVTSEQLYAAHAALPEGELTKMRASLVCEPTLALDARELSLGGFLLLGKGEDATGGRERDSVLSDALEALIGALYLDGGLAVARSFIMRHVLNDKAEQQRFQDSKTRLQELVQQGDKEEIVYELVETSGPDHDRRFFVELRIGGRLSGRGSGSSKKAAEQAAATEALATFREKGTACI